MGSRAARRAPLIASVAMLLWLVFPWAAAAEQLPVKVYTVENGLAHNRIKHIVQDSRGFLWFCTADGLSRFDGSQFVNYQLEDGLLAPSINDIVEAGDGTYWIATNSDGVFRFDPRVPATATRTGVARFTRIPVGTGPVSNRVNVLLRDPAGTLWAGTDGGLFALPAWDPAHRESGGFREVPLHVPQRSDIQVSIWSFARDRAGTLWIGTKYGLVRRSADGAIRVIPVRPGPDDDNVMGVTRGADGRLWLGHREGLFSLDPTAPEPVLRRYTTRDGLESDNVMALHSSPDGRIWIKTLSAGLTEFDGTTFRTYGLGARGTDAIGALTEDREGNLWLGTNAFGVIKITKRGWTTYGQPEGLGSSVTSIFETPRGELFVSSRAWLVSRLQDARFATVRPQLPSAVTDASWRDINNFLQDRAGGWWVGTRFGLLRFPATPRFEDLARTPPSAVYTTRDGLAQDDVGRLFEDSRGDIWIASWLPAHDVVVRWDRATGAFHRYSERDGLRPFTSAVTFVEDAAGGVWIGFREGGLVRYRDGGFSEVVPSQAGAVNGAYRDPSGRLWAAVRSGLFRVDDPAAPAPRLTVYGRAQGFVDTVQVVTGDTDGRIYAGTSRGVDRLDPRSGEVTHFSAANGLTGGEFKSAFRDRHGVLWFCTTSGLSRFVPGLEETALPPPVLIGGVRIAGIARPLSALGESTLVLPSLQPDQNNVQIDFFGIALRTGDTLRYQYRLEGADGGWSAPSPQRSVDYANLAPGRYRFLVRAVGMDGTPSAAPALASFEILPPLWRRWWFLAAAALLISTTGAGVARYRHRRVEALRESENRFRTLTETASDAIITIDHRSRIVLVNQAAEKVFGYSRDEMIGADLTMLMPPALRDRHTDGFSRYMQSGSRSMAWDAIALPGLHKDGHEFPLEISFGEFSRNGRRYFTGIARDITERRRAEEALRRSREERLAELERVRRRIATDLHDDIGSSLTRISLLGEVAQRQVQKNPAALVEPLGTISHLSRELVDTMSDIVWAINPNKDHLSDLSQRMRHFASDLFTARQIAFRFRTPDADRDVAVGANVRRELFLLFKEAVNNAVRHSGCTEADLELRVEPDGLVLVVSDNGRGFDVSRNADGHGLASMRERTEGLGGVFDVLSRPGEGTLLSFRIPFAHDSPHEYAVTRGRSRP